MKTGLLCDLIKKCIFIVYLKYHFQNIHGLQKKWMLKVMLNFLKIPELLCWMYKSHEHTTFGLSSKWGTLNCKPIS